MPSLREEAKQKYVELIKRGYPLSLRDFAARSEEFIGSHVPLSTVLSWSRDDAWLDSTGIIDFTSSQELREIRQLLDVHLDHIMQHSDTDPARELASSSSGYRKLVKKLPKHLVFLIEDELIAVRNGLHSYVMRKKDSAPKSNLATITGVWADLGNLLIPDLPTDKAEGVVEADLLILRRQDESSLSKS